MNIIKSRYNTTKDTGVVILNEFDKAYTYQKFKNLDRLNKAWRRYFPVDNGKWSEAELKIMAEEYRQPSQFDIVGPKLDTFIGSLVSDLPDPTWSPILGQKSELTEAIAAKWYRDKEIGNYDDVLLRVFRDGAVQSGDLQIVEDYDCGTPVIKFVRVLPGRIIWEPYWETDDDRDAMVAYRYEPMSIGQIVRKYGFASDDIKREYEEYKKDMSNYPTTDNHKTDPLITARIGDILHVIEKHYVEEINTVRLIGRAHNGNEFIPFPINKPREYLEAFAEYNNIDWTTVNETPYTDKIHKVTTVIRELVNAEIQIDKKSKIQTKGLPFYHFTMMRYLGQDMGLPESMSSVEDTINKRESLITELISKANGGSDMFNEKLFNGDMRKFAEWNKKKNKPGHSELVDLDAVKTPFVKIAQNQYPSAVVDQVNRMYDRVMPIVSRVSEALSSISDGSDSGILFERKFQTNMIANTLPNRAMRQFINNIAEGYFWQFQITYSGYEHKVELKSGKEVTLNAERNGVMYNDVTNIPRCRVVIVENRKSTTYQMRWRSVWAEMLQSINPQVALPYYMLSLKNFFDTIEMNDEDKSKSEALGDMMMTIANLDTIQKITSLQTQSQSNTLQGAQIQMQMDMLMRQMQSAMAQEPSSHMGGATETQQVNYPEQGFSNKNVTLSPIEAASRSAQIPPAMTGAQQ